MNCSAARLDSELVHLGTLVFACVHCCDGLNVLDVHSHFYLFCPVVGIFEPSQKGEIKAPLTQSGK